MTTQNLEELEQSIVYLLESLTTTMAAGGPSLNPARETLREFLRSDKVLDPEYIKRLAGNLAATAEETAGHRQPASAEVKKDLSAEPGRTKGNGLEGESPGLLLAVINHVVSLRPKHYQDWVQTLESMIQSEAPLEEILQKLVDMILQIKEDFWEERSKAFKHIEDILKSLEVTEKDFIGSLDANHNFVKDSNLSFTFTMDKGLKDIGSLAAPGKFLLDELCRQLALKVRNLRDCVQNKKKADQAHLAALDAERVGAHKRFVRNQRDYEEFTRQSHEMLQEIENLRAISLRDPLTDVYNRRAYDNQIIKTLTAFKVNALKTCGLIVFDIDNFREFNNIYGHLAGDKVLSNVARLTRETLRRDDLVFRYGGDEFVILIPNATLEAAMGVAEKIRKNIYEVDFKLFKTSEVTARVSVSMGVSEIKEGDDAVTFFARADQAMYKSKSSGRNRVSPGT